MIRPVFYNRDLSSFLVQPGVEWKVKRYSKRAIGGCYEAMLEATGSDLALWELVEMLRCPVELYAAEGDAVWWGYVSEVEITASNPYSFNPMPVRFGASIDTMFNRVAVAYIDQVVGTQTGQRYTTTWADDSFSQDTYGVKEALWSGESATDRGLAEQARDILLAQKKLPVPVVDLNIRNQKNKAQVFCRGWWDTLSWKYATVPITLAMERVRIGSEVGFTFGAVQTQEKLAQIVDVTGGDINAAEIHVSLLKFGAPTDNVVLGLYTASTASPGAGSLPSGSGVPDQLLDEATIAGTTIDTNTDPTTGLMQTYTFSFSPEVALTNLNSYYIVISRSGSMDPVNYYQAGVFVPIGLTQGGVFEYYNGTATRWYDANYRLPYQIYENDVVETSLQLNALITAYGEFFSGVMVDIESGVTSESYRDGDATAMFEIEQLLQHGTDNLRRMLAEVDIGRRVRVYEEPQSTTQYVIFTDSTMKDPYNGTVRKETAPAGIWSRWADVIPPSVNSTLIGDPSLRFIEEVEYDAEKDQLNFTARDELDPFDVGRPTDG